MTLRLMATAALALLGGCALAGHRGAPNPLHAAGFQSRPARTPQLQSMLVRLPAHRFVRHRHGHQVSYVYADPAGCDCLYVGSAGAYRRYLRRGSGAPVDYADNHWDWRAWGAFGPGFRWGPALGW